MVVVVVVVVAAAAAAGMLRATTEISLVTLTLSLCIRLSVCPSVSE